MYPGGAPGDQAKRSGIRRVHAGEKEGERRTSHCSAGSWAAGGRAELLPAAVVSAQSTPSFLLLLARCFPPWHCAGYPASPSAAPLAVPRKRLPLLCNLQTFQLENHFIKTCVRQQSPKQAEAVTIYTQKYASLCAKLSYRNMFILKKELSYLPIPQGNVSSCWSSAPSAQQGKLSAGGIPPRALQQERLRTSQALVHTI